MGMYDKVKGLPDIECQRCGAIIPHDSWQSKDGECGLEDVAYYELYEFYTTCPECDAWHTFNRKPMKIPLSQYILCAETDNGEMVKVNHKYKVVFQKKPKKPKKNRDKSWRVPLGEGG